MSKSFDIGPRPVEIRHKQAEKELEVEFDDGATFTLPAELLRVESPSAEVQGHGPSQKTLIAGRREVGMMAIVPVGNYAIRITFDDLHDTGIYTWSYLYDMGTNLDAVWSSYIDALEAAGLGRDPKG